MLGVEKQKQDQSSTLEPLYKYLLEQKFSSATSAFEFCQKLCLQYGFPIKQKTNSNQMIYVHCSYRPPFNIQGSPLSPLKKQRSSVNMTDAYHSNDCQWHIILCKTVLSEWIFKQSNISTINEHNHELSSGVNITKLKILTENTNDNLQLPIEIQEQIKQLLYQNSNMQTDKIYETIKQQLQLLSKGTLDCNKEREFYNYVTKIRKQLKEEEITKGIQQLILVSTRLCSIIASNKIWTTCVANELTNMIEDYQQILGLSNQELDQIVSLQPDMICSLTDITTTHNAHSISCHKSAIEKKNVPVELQNQNSLVDKRQSNKKRALDHKENVNCYNKTKNHPLSIVISIPSCTLNVRAQPLRSSLAIAATAIKMEQQYSPHLYNNNNDRRIHFTSLDELSITNTDNKRPQMIVATASTGHFGISAAATNTSTTVAPASAPAPAVANFSSIFSLSSPIISPQTQQRIAYNGYQNNSMHHCNSIPTSPLVFRLTNNNKLTAGHEGNMNHANYDSTNMYALQSPYLSSQSADTIQSNSNTNELHIPFDSSSYHPQIPSYSYQHTSHRQQHDVQQSPLSSSNYLSMSYYNSNNKNLNEVVPKVKNYHNVISMNTNSIQQRILLEDEYEEQEQLQRQIGFVPITHSSHVSTLMTNTNKLVSRTESNSNIDATIRLPIIRSSHHQFINNTSNWT
ncbi:uncharacterized protein BX663DRAFT_497976 [Cokeromyces recurvatus]|uniref:uncharacterized protein n=1 Tax=Cokeromyces recurvatus TaxID=90255 RepID=UPI002220C11F|nr:uncharacterized protein BX663DRAFT_497976 [Cokeromyces recurvatus]KAI7905878.1 hypothetical protein BX663DRAFT_497976 [Cokeromyces recurvatus]